MSIYTPLQKGMLKKLREREDQVMDTERRLLQWSAWFQIPDGKLVCRGCLAGQGLMDAEQAFSAHRAL
ncbi:hypothetical protein DBY65_005570 [Pseudomonas sp. RIT412]|nr:hypothetical protein DBP26_005095 [Pseudomonas sp. RIT 409]RAU55384.1 hypothetical protein DBY65_005570 [Pseudomonas sp. RIT 412]